MSFIFLTSTVSIIVYFDVVLGFRTVEFHPLWFCTSLIFITSTILSGTRFQALCRIYKSTSTKYARIFIHLNNLFIVIFGNLDKIVLRCQEDLLIYHLIKPKRCILKDLWDQKVLQPSLCLCWVTLNCPESVYLFVLLGNLVASHVFNSWLSLKGVKEILCWNESSCLKLIRIKLKATNSNIIGENMSAGKERERRKNLFKYGRRIFIIMIVDGHLHGEIHNWREVDQADGSQRYNILCYLSHCFYKSKKCRR